MRAGVCAVLAAAGDLAAAMVHAELVAEHVLTSPLSQGPAALAFVASVLGRSEDAVLRHRSRALLAQRGSSLLVVGAGAACLGPIDRYMAQLAPDRSTCNADLRAALQFARRTGQQRWIECIEADFDQLP